MKSVKMGFSLFLIMALLCAISAFPAMAAEDLKLDFNTYKVGPAPAAVLVAGKPEAGKLLIKERAANDYYLEATDESDAETYGFRYDLKGYDKRFTMAFDFMRSAATKGTPMLYIFDRAAAWPAGPSLFLGPKLSAFNGTTQETSTADLKNDTWHKIVLDISPETGKLSVYVDGKQAFTDIGFRNPNAKKMDFLQLTGNLNPSPVTFGFDNARIYAGAPSTEDLNVPPPAPTKQPAGDAVSSKELPAYGAALKALREKISDSVVLFLDTPATLVKGAYTNVDPDNNLVVPFTENDRTLVPVRFIAQNFGAQVSWDESTQEVGIVQGSTKITLTIGSKVMKVGDKEITLDTPANTYNGRTLIPLRALVEALGKKVLWDDRGLIAISAQELSLTEAEKDMLCLLFVNPNEQGAYAARGSVMMSSRWYRSGPNQIQGDIGTLDAIKRFMATDDTWSYIYDEEQIKSIVNTGVSFQGTNNMNQGWNGKKGEGIPGTSLDFDGNPITPSWMTWGSPSGCVNREEYVQTVLNLALKAVGAGATAFQHDDAGANYGLATYVHSGCFCPDCMSGFTKFLKENYTSDEITKLGIEGFSDTFNLKDYLKAKGVTKVDWEAKYKIPKAPVYLAFLEFNKESNRKYYERIRKELSAAAKTNVTLMANEFPWWISDLSLPKQLMREDFNYGHAENYDNFDIYNLGVGGTFMAAVDAPIIMTQVSRAKRADQVNTGIALAYATGHWAIFPWDVYLSGTDPRHFGTIYEFGDTFSFIRENNFLFNNFELDSKVKVLVNWSDITADQNAKFKDFLFKFIKAGVPFEMAIVSYDDLYIKRSLKADQFSDGTTDIICYSGTDTLSEKDKAIVDASGAKKIAKADATDEYIAALAGVKVDETEAVYTKLRGKGEQKALHLINTETFTKQLALNVRVPLDFIKNADDVYYYMPGKDAVKLSAKVEGSDAVLTVPELENWGIIGFNINQKTITFDVAKGVNAFNVGNPAAWGEVKGDFAQLDVKSKGVGIGAKTPLDNALNDQGTYVFSHITSPIYRDFSVEAKMGEGSALHKGVMIRESAASNSKMVGLLKSEGNMVMYTRQETNGAIAQKKIEAVGDYVKLVKNAGGVKGFVSSDGVSYKEVFSVDCILSLGTAGVFTAAGEAKYENIKVQTLGTTLTKKDIVNFSFKDKSGEVKTKKQNYNPITAEILGQKVFVNGNIAKFKSSDPSIAMVDDNGVVTGYKNGKVTITATIETADGSVEASATLDMVEKVVIFSEDFENTAVDSLPSGFTATGVPFEGAYAGVVEEIGTGKYVKIAVTGVGRSVDVTKGFPNLLTKDFDIEFDYKVEFDGKTGNGSKVLYLMGGSTMAISTFSHPNPGKFSWFDNKSMQQVADMENGKWYKMKFEVNVPSKTMNWYINGKLVAKDAPFRQAAESIGSLTIGTTTNAVGTTVYFDNIKAIER